MKRVRSLSLRQWIYRNARLPLLVSLLSILAVESLLLGVIGKNQLELQEGVANRLAELSRLALTQGSTPLLQTGFEIAVRELRASQAFLCEKGLVLVLSTPKVNECAIEPRFGYRVLRVPLEGNRPFEFILQVPILPQENLIYYTLGISVLVCISGMFLLRRVGYRLERDLFVPLFKNLSSQFHLPIKELEVLRTKDAVASAVMARNVQVAHDIKSPLTALLFASKDFDSLPSTSRQVISSAVQRISAIADSLIESKEKKSEMPHKDLNGLIHEMILEKKIEYQECKKIEWEEALTNLSKKYPISVEPAELKRVLSNLINNAVESIEACQGRIQVGAKMTDSAVQIWVEDTGRGFPLDLVSRIGERGLTRGKRNGQGLGLSYAYEIVKSAGGSILIEPVKSGGTRVVLSF